MLAKPALPFFHPACLLATWFGSGLLPKMPGTWGSLAALPFGIALAWAGGAWALCLGAALVFLVGIWASGVYARAAGVEDPGAVVIDEVAGQWLVLAPIAGQLALVPLAFLLFRIFDTWKPWPIGWLEHRVKGGFGIMLDDLAAALYAGAGCALVAELLNK